MSGSDSRGNAKAPLEMNPAGLLFWRRPTLAQPIVALPSRLQRFTSVFGMGTGGATALLSPEPNGAGAARLWRSLKFKVRGLISQSNIKHRTSDIKHSANSLISTYRKYLPLQASFYLI